MDLNLVKFVADTHLQANTAGMFCSYPPDRETVCPEEGGVTEWPQLGWGVIVELDAT